jgi:hypothetical protein
MMQSRKGRVGACLSPGWLVSADGPAPWTREVADPADGAVLESALRELRQHAGGGVLHLALMPPLVDLRRIELPRLRPDEVGAVLCRDARRYFPAGRGSQAIAVEMRGPAGAGRVAALAAAAPEALVDGLWEAARRAGWDRVRIVPAHAAWTAAARLWPAALRNDGSLVLAAGGRVEALVLWRGRLAGVRRFPLSAELEDLETERPVGLAGPTPWQVEAGTALAERGAQVLQPRAGTPVPEGAEWLAAEWAHAAAELELAPPRVLAGGAGRARRVAAILAGCAAALLLAALLIDQWGARRELAAIRTARAQISLAAAQADSVRRAAEMLSVRNTTLAALEGSAPAWPVVLASIAESLPQDAYLTAFRAEADSLVLQGEARRASVALDALRGTAGLAGVRMSGPVRREPRPGAPPVERFVISARLGEHGAAPDSAALSSMAALETEAETETAETDSAGAEETP